MNKYLKRTKNKTLKYCYTDTTFIINKRGIDFKERNKFMKNKYCNKLSLVVDNNFIPIDIKIFKDRRAGGPEKLGRRNIKK